MTIDQFKRLEALLDDYVELLHETYDPDEDEVLDALLDEAMGFANSSMSKLNSYGKLKFN